MTAQKQVAKKATAPKKAAKKKATAPKKAAKSDLREVHTIQELVDLVVMSPIEFFELSAKQDESGEDKGDPEIRPAFVLQVGHPSDGIAIRLTVEIANGKGRVRADAGVIYSTRTKEDITPISEVLGLEFANQVAIFALIPYLREAVANISSRVLGNQITLPMLRKGELTFSPDAPI